MENKLGKIEHHLVEDFIQHKCGFHRKEVNVGPQFGVDVSVVDLKQGQAMALTSDPLTLIPSLGLEESAWLTVHLMANDMATTGHAPMFAQFVLNLPETFTKSNFKIYWDYVHKFCQEIGVSITGGHTGFIPNQNSTIAGGGTFITVADRNKILVSKMAKAGDSILVSKQSAISSAAILAMSFPETTKNMVGLDTYQKACESFYQTSSLQDALTAVGENLEHTDITAMHDVTEGGVLGAIYELSVASNNGVLVYDDKIPVGNIQHQICNAFELDYRHCIGAGSMIITCKKGSASNVIKRLADKGIACTEVGIMEEKQCGRHLLKGGLKSKLIYFEEDPYWAVFSKAIKSGWK